MPGGARESKTSENRLTSAERQRQALELRKAGETFQAIADKLGYQSVSSAYESVMAGLKRTLQEPADAVRRLELERLDRLWLALWPRALQGELDVLDRCVKLMHRRALLLGLDTTNKNVMGQIEHVERHEHDIRAHIDQLASQYDALAARALAPLGPDGSNGTAQPVDPDGAPPQTGPVPGL